MKTTLFTIEKFPNFLEKRMVFNAVPSSAPEPEPEQVDTTAQAPEIPTPPPQAVNNTGYKPKEQNKGLLSGPLDSELLTPNSIPKALFHTATVLPITAYIASKIGNLGINIGTKTAKNVVAPVGKFGANQAWQRVSLPTQYAYSAVKDTAEVIVKSPFQVANMGVNGLGAVAGTVASVSTGISSKIFNTVRNITTRPLNYVTGGGFGVTKWIDEVAQKPGSALGSVSTSSWNFAKTGYSGVAENGGQLVTGVKQLATEIPATGVQVASGLALGNYSPSIANYVEETQNKLKNSSLPKTLFSYGAESAKEKTLLHVDHEKQTQFTPSNNVFGPKPHEKVA